MKISLNFPDTLLEKMDSYCAKHDYERSEFVRMLVRERLEIHPIPSTPPIEIPPNVKPVTSTLPVGNPEMLWEDHNLMPVYKTGEDDQFCTTWHQKGLKQRVYQIKKFRGDGTLELEGKYCKSCIEGFLKQDGHLE